MPSEPTAERSVTGEGSMVSSRTDARRRDRRLVPAIGRQMLPHPTTEAWSWLLNARCRGSDTDVFFTRDGERPDAARRRQQRAIACCARCEVVAECGDYALRYQEPWGVWGGLSESERRRILNLRDRRQL